MKKTINIKMKIIPDSARHCDVYEIRKCNKIRLTVIILKII